MPPTIKEIADLEKCLRQRDTLVHNQALDGAAHLAEEWATFVEQQFLAGKCDEDEKRACVAAALTIARKIRQHKVATAALSKASTP